MLKSTSRRSMSDGMQNLNIVQETAARDTQHPGYIPDRDPPDLNPLPVAKRRHIQPLPEEHSVHSIFSGETTQQDVNRIVSRCFASGCGRYYQRYLLLEELIKSKSPEDELFMTALGSGPMYLTDCCRFVHTYVNKFKKHLLMKDTILSDLRKVKMTSCPPVDIHEQLPFMDLLGYAHYIVAEGTKATDALSALKNNFSIIDCNMAYEIAYYEAILELIGKNNFNKAFDRSSSTPLTIHLHGNDKTSLKNFMSEQKALPDDNPSQQHTPPENLQKGTVYYFRNHKDYLDKHPDGSAQGFNVMFVQKRHNIPCFTAFGFPESGLTPSEISNELLALFNRDPCDNCQGVPVYDNLAPTAKEAFDKLKEKTITLEELHANGGGWFRSQGEYLDINKIKAGFTHLAPMRYRVKRYLQPMAGPLTGMFLALLTGAIICSVFLKQFEASEPEGSDPFHLQAALLVAAAFLGGISGLYCQRCVCSQPLARRLCSGWRKQPPLVLDTSDSIASSSLLSLEKLETTV